MRLLLAILTLVPSVAFAQCLTARQRDAILASAVADATWCVGQQCFSLPAVAEPRRQASAAGQVSPATPVPAAAPKLTLLFFTQADCAPCRRTEALQRDPNIAKWLRNGFRYRVLDIRQSGSIYDVYRTPTHIVLKDGREIARFGAPADAAHYARMLDSAWRLGGGKR